MPDIEVREFFVPQTEGAPGWNELVEYAELSNAVMRQEIGVPDLDEPAAQVRSRLSDPYSISRCFGAYRDGQLVGVGEMSVDREQTVGSAWAVVAPAARGRGVGSELLTVICDAAVQAGATTMQTGSYHTDLVSEPRLRSPAGPGSIPADASTARFLQDHGFKLGQVEIISARRLPVPEEFLAALIGDVRPADDYDLLDWTGPVPEELIDGYARLRTAVSTAVPSGELTEEEQLWDADRVRSRDRRNTEAGLITHTCVARHRPSADLVGFSTLARPAAADGRAVTQGYTMVLPEHRGHNLGIRIKINNLRSLMATDHGAARIITGNAGENEAMLRINRALGFRPFLVCGWWELKLTG